MEPVVVLVLFGCLGWVPVVWVIVWVGFRYRDGPEHSFLNLEIRNYIVTDFLQSFEKSPGPKN